MKGIILAAALLTGGTVTAQVFIKSPKQSSTWSRQLFTGDMVYVNDKFDDNYEIYNQAVSKLSSFGMDFFSPDDVASIGNRTLTDMVYEKEPFGSGSEVTMTYSSDTHTAIVKITEIRSYIVISKK